MALGLSFHSKGSRTNNNSAHNSSARLLLLGRRGGARLCNTHCARLLRALQLAADCLAAGQHAWVCEKLWEGSSCQGWITS